MINATKEKVGSYFLGNSQFIVPFFQRAYVWDEDNWTTFWEHISVVLECQEKNISAEHFIGTIITKERPAEQIGQSEYDLIDGQQRLTTIALLLKAISNASNGQMPNLKGTISEHLSFRDARGKSFPRIVPSGYDKPYYDAILSGNGLQNLQKEDHKINRAYRFFFENLTGFSDERLDLLRRIILDRVPVISMMLSPEDDEQEIFDTINALGVRLTTGELLKNYIFKEKSIQSNYDSLWKDIYEGDEDQVDFWNAEKTAGRIIRTNIEVLLYCYLIVKKGGDIKLEKLFKEYKEWLSDKTAEDKIAFLNELKEYAEIYSSFPSGTDLNQIGFNEEEKRFFHIVENLAVTTIYPLILYIYKTVSSKQLRNEMLRILESYLARRNICRLTTKNYNSLFIQIMSKLEEYRRTAGALNSQTLVDIMQEFNDPTNIMPADRDFHAAFKSEILSNQNAREILFIIALHQVSTDLADMPKLSLGNYSVEHMMPVKWETNWLDREMTLQEKSDRNLKLRTLGNLTLVTKKLNSKMQNSAWSDKKTYLKKNSSLRTTVDYLDEKIWDETSIEKRADDLANAAAKIWKWTEVKSPLGASLLGDSPGASKSHVISERNNRARTVRKRPIGELTEDKRVQFKFWTVYKVFVESNSSIPCSKPCPRQFITHSLGRPGIHLASIASMLNSVTNTFSTPELRIELVVYSRRAKAEFSALENKKQEIEDAIGLPLIWYNPDRTRVCSVYTRQDADIRNQKLWPEQHKWLLETLQRFHRVFSPLVIEITESSAAKKNNSA